MAGSTIADVAQLAGVSTATVSRVLTGSVPVSEKLQQRVREAAAELDYLGNPAARALRRERTAAAGMIVPDLANPFFTQLVDGVEQQLQQLGMSLHLCSSHNDLDTEAERIRSLLSAHIEVLVVTPVHLRKSAAILRQASARVPILQLDQYAEGVESAWVGVDEEYGMRLVIEHLAEQGVRSVAYVGGLPTDSSALRRYRAARQTAAEIGVELVESEHLLGSFSVEWGRQAARLIASGPLPDAVSCGADVVALGVLEGFDALGIRVPEDVLLTGFDDIGLSAHPRLSITTVRQPLEAITRSVATLLPDIIEHPQSHRPGRHAIPPTLIARGSTTRSRPPARKPKDELSD